MDMWWEEPISTTSSTGLKALLLLLLLTAPSSFCHLPHQQQIFPSSKLLSWTKQPPSLGSMKKRDAARLDSLLRRAGSVVGTQLESLGDQRQRKGAVNTLLDIMDSTDHPLHRTLTGQTGTFSGRLMSLSSSTDRLRRSTVQLLSDLYLILCISSLTCFVNTLVPVPAIC